MPGNFRKILASHPNWPSLLTLIDGNKRAVTRSPNNPFCGGSYLANSGWDAYDRKVPGKAGPPVVSTIAAYVYGSYGPSVGVAPSHVTSAVGPYVEGTGFSSSRRLTLNCVR